MGWRRIAFSRARNRSALCQQPCRQLWRTAVSCRRHKTRWRKDRARPPAFPYIPCRAARQVSHEPATMGTDRHLIVYPKPWTRSPGPRARARNCHRSSNASCRARAPANTDLLPMTRIVAAVRFPAESGNGRTCDEAKGGSSRRRSRVYKPMIDPMDCPTRSAAASISRFPRWA